MIQSKLTTKDSRYFLLRRLHSLTGVIPIGIFLVMHLWTNTKAIQGRHCFDHAVNEINQLPFLPMIEIIGIFLPLAFHSLYGIKLAFEARSNVSRYGYTRNWLFLLQRLTGLLTLIFLIVHLKDFRIAKMLGGMSHQAFFDELSRQLSTRAKAILYLFGVTASIFHFANGLRTFLFAWGVTISKKSQRYAAYTCFALGCGLWFLGANTVLFFATGGATFVPSSLTRGEHGRDRCEEIKSPL